MDPSEISGEKKGPLFYLTLNRPAKRNAINFDMLIQLSEMVEAQITDPEVRVIILRGEGPVFSAGIDFQALGMLVTRYKEAYAAGGAYIRSDIHKYQHYLNRLESIEIPIICAMHSRAFGLSLEIALACDIRVMSRDCQWAMPELRIGPLSDMGGTARLSRVLGASRAMEVLMTGKLYSAEKALEWGLVNHVFPDDQLLSETEKLALEIAANSPLAVGATKKIIKRGDGVDLMTQLDLEGYLQSIILRSEDFEEGVAAKMEGRPPIWKRK
ncbi:MAG: enoyl-CoA hydratase/isomerase family protein [Pseudomonadota bacterium]